MENRQLLSATTIVVTTSADSIALGQSEVLTATVTSTGGTPSVGTVTFFDGPTAISAPIAIGADGTASFTTGSLPGGANTITATYSGGGTFDPSATEVNWNSIALNIAGTGSAGFSGDGGPAVAALMNDTEFLVVDLAGNVYFDDFGNDIVRRIDAVTHVITSYAGNGIHGVIGDGGLATDAELDNPGGLAVDAAGNLYIADTGAECIREVNAVTHVITTIAGTNNQFGFAGDGGPATSALMEFFDSSDSGISIDAAGNLYISDSYNSRIRKVDATTHIISTVTGDGDFATPLENVPASSSAINDPFGIATDYAGNLYITMFGSRVSRIDAATGLISTYAGNGTYGYSGDGGPATSAQIAQSRRLAFDASGNMYIGDTGDGYLRRVDVQTHIITTVMGYSGTAITFDSANNLYVSGGAYNNVVEYKSGGAAVMVSKITPTVVASDNGGTYSGSAYPASASATGLGGVTVSGTDIFTYYQGSDTTGAVLSGAPVDAGTYTVVAAFTSTDPSYGNAVSEPVTFTISDADSSVSVVASTNSVVYQGSVTLTATVTSPAGTPNSGTISFWSGATFLGSSAVGSNGKGSIATQLLPVGHDLVTAVYSQGGNFAGSTSPRITIDVGQAVSSIALTTSATSISFGQSITLTATVTSTATIDGGFVTFYDGNTPLGIPVVVGRDGKAQESVTSLVTGIHAMTASYSGSAIIAASRTTLTSSSVIDTIAGNGTAGFTGNNVIATTAELNTPAGIAVDANGDLFIADYVNNVVREVDPTTHLITTIAGGGSHGAVNFSGQATDAKLNGPISLALDNVGDLFIADATNNVIREVVLATGAITTVAGGGTNNGNGVLATAAVLQNPQGVAVDTNGVLYIAEYGRNAVREVDPGTHLITTVAGNGIHGYLGDNGAATSAELAYPTGVTVDGQGNLFIADYGNNVIRKVANGIITTVAGNHTSISGGEQVAATSVGLHGPFGVSVDSSGNVYFAETYNHSIRVVEAATQKISTFSGTGSVGFSGDNGPSNTARLSYPTGVAIDPFGDVFIADQGNNRIREIVAGQVVIVTPSVPTVTTPTTTSITSGSAVLGGTIASDGGAPVAATGFLYALTSVNANPTLGGVGVSSAVGSATSATFTANVTGLDPNASYTFVAFAANVAGISYSSLGTFNTLPAPTVTGVDVSQVYTKGSEPIPIAANVSIADPNGYDIISAIVTVANWQGEDRLSFLNSYALQHTFTVNSSTNIATLTLTGSATSAAYQATLQTLMYQDVNSNVPVMTTRMVSITINDGYADSDPVSTNITYQNVDLAPLLSTVDTTSVTATANGDAVILSSTVAVTDPDSNSLNKLVIQITSGYQHSANNQDVLLFNNQNGIVGLFDMSTGTLTLTGHSSLSNYRLAMRSILFSSTGPSIATGTRTLTFTATDDDVHTSGVSSIPVTRHVNVKALPTFSGANPTQIFIKGSPPTVIAPSLVISESLTAQITSATVTITNWQGEDRLTFYNFYALQHTFTVNSATQTATLTLTGNASAAAYQATLRTVMYQDVNHNAPNLSVRTATITVTDNSSNTASTAVSIYDQNVNLSPVLSVIETNPLVYTVNGLPVAISSTILVNDPDSNSLGRLTIQISSGYQNNAQGNDRLSFVNQNGISGSFDAVTGTLTLNGISSLSHYRSAVRSVLFSSSGSSISTTARTLTISGFDDGTPTPLSSNSVTRTILIST